MISIFQTIIVIIETFVFSVLAIYTLNQYCFKQNETFKVYIYVTVEWFLIYLIATVTIIYIAHLVRNEVSKLYSNTDFVCKCDWFGCSLFSLFQGKSTFQIVHELINQCNDADISTKVIWTLFLVLLDFLSAFYSSTFKIVISIVSTNWASLSSGVLWIVRIWLVSVVQCKLIMMIGKVKWI